ncbi:hypothetical protein [Staphylococcus hominis]|uniref:hypothetical protein n=1 Tax=Staphylococcus hominis TaxID=1290 RepID=UPI002DBABA97|nr:hypothetical protein [Staphylococcus hominis]MEB5793094.1 hypothetical protein [Staphylococcus hominis]
MNDHHQYNYVNPNKLSLDWERFVISKSEMLLDGVPSELIQSWLDREIIEPFSIRNNELNFKTKDIWNALKQQNWYYPNSN